MIMFDHGQVGIFNDDDDVRVHDIGSNLRPLRVVTFLTSNDNFYRQISPFWIP